MVKKTQSIQETAVPLAAAEENPEFAGLHTSLAEINKPQEVIGYILRNTNSAIIDLKNHASLTEYALLASQAIDSVREIAELFNLGSVENILITSKDTKVLCITRGENNIAIFMEKNANHNDILTQL